MGVFNSKNSSVDVLFQLALRSFDYEYDRSKKLEGKASIFVGIIGVMFTLSSGYFALKLKKIDYFTKISSLHLFIFSTIAYLVAIYNFFKVLKTQKFYVLEYQTYFSEEYINNYTENEIKESMILGYNEVLEDIKVDNENKADYYDRGLNYTLIAIIFSFILMCTNFFNK